MLSNRPRPAAAHRPHSRWLRLECGAERSASTAVLRAAARAASGVTHLGLRCPHHDSRECLELERSLRELAARKRLAFAAPRLDN